MTTLEVQHWTPITEVVSLNSMLGHCNDVISYAYNERKVDLESEAEENAVAE